MDAFSLACQTSSAGVDPLLLDALFLDDLRLGEEAVVQLRFVQLHFTETGVDYSDDRKAWWFVGQFFPASCFVGWFLRGSDAAGPRPEESS